LDGIEQIQINHGTGYTLSRALRNILRHDPDVILVGEIRDQERGGIAVESTLTGHLILILCTPIRQQLLRHDY
jgi:type IV pilus assembly protein PilB